MMEVVDLKYLSLFSGIEAASLAWEPLGWECMAVCENDEFPAAVLAHRFPDVPNLGDVTKIDWGDFVNTHGKPDVLVGGSPCFVAGTLVLCEDGFKPIEDVVVGDKVVTHNGRLRKVLRTGHRQAQVGDLKIHGMMKIRCTPSHPILASRRTKQDRDENGCWFRFDDEEFVEASQSVGMCACSVRDVDCDIPDFPDVYGIGRGDILELIGWYLGDGSIQTKGKRNPTLRALVLTINPNKFVRFVSVFKQKLKYRVCEVDKNRCTVYIYNTELCRFVEHWFGKGACNKNLPAWAYALPAVERERLLSGYASTDGTVYQGGRIEIESVSKSLIIGMQMLLGEGSTCAITPRGTKTINGVEYVVKPTFKFSHKEDCRGNYEHNGYIKRLVRSFKELQEETVYNLEVEDDNSYTADGIAVHNCQSFSLAGGRESLGGASRLMYEYIRACDEIRSEWILWENVPGVLSTKDNAFGQLLCSLQDIGYESLAWRVLDAQFFGVPQRRRRVFLVGHLGTGGGAAAVLFEPESMCGDITPSKQKREELAACLGGRSGGSAGGGAVTGQSGIVTMASGQANAEIDTGGAAPTLTRLHEAPIVARPSDP